MHTICILVLTLFNLLKGCKIGCSAYLLLTSHAGNKGVKTVNHGEISSINITAWLARLFENNEKKGALGSPFLFLERSSFPFEVTYIITYKYRQWDLFIKWEVKPLDLLDVKQVK